MYTQRTYVSAMRKENVDGRRDRGEKDQLERPGCRRRTSPCGSSSSPPQGRPAKRTHKKQTKPTKYHFSLTSKFLPPRRKKLVPKFCPLPTRGSPRRAGLPKPSRSWPRPPALCHSQGEPSAAPPPPRASMVSPRQRQTHAAGPRAESEGGTISSLEAKRRGRMCPAGPPWPALPPR